jgi:hypothetical protein
VVKWIVLAVVLVGLLVLFLAVLPLLGRLPKLDRAVRRMRLRQEDAQRLQVAAADLQEKAVDLRARAEEAQQRITLIKAKRGDD